jgi:tripartite-type tricarboxylate transporter receptor subunit TctC
MRYSPYSVIGGRVPLIIEGYSGLAGAIQAHNVNVLAVESAHRLPDFPDLPTVAETLPGFAAAEWQGMVAPLGTPAAAIQKINESLRKVLSESALAKQLALRGAYVDPMSPSEVNTFMQPQFNDIRKHAKSSGWGEQTNDQPWVKSLLGSINTKSI